MAVESSVEVILYTSLRGAAPIEVATVRVPLTLKSASSQTIEGRLTATLEYAAENIKTVFAEMD